MTNGGEVIALSSLEHQDAEADAEVFYTSDISSEAMTEIYNALGQQLTGENIAVKLSTGEPPASNYLDPNLIADLVHQVNGTIVENNTAYGGQRSGTAMHYQVAEDHGFTEIADFVVMDENGSVSLPVEGGTQLTENLVGAHFPEYDGYLVLSHFKGHAMAGFGGAIKNISIGMASQEGKCLIHTAGESHTSPWGGEQDPFTESMAEAGKSVVDALDGNILYVSVMNHLSVDCDCDGNPAEPDMHDIGILASADPADIRILGAGNCPWILRIRISERKNSHSFSLYEPEPYGNVGNYTGKSSWHCIAFVYVWHNPVGGFLFQKRNAG